MKLTDKILKLIKPIKESVETDVLNSYLTTALWSSTDEDGEPLDSKFSIDDFSPEALEQAKKELDEFMKEADTILSSIEDVDMETVAHDFWLTRNNHGAGFWDGDYPEEDGDKLTEISNNYGETNLYVGDDGKLYFM